MAFAGLMDAGEDRIRHAKFRTAGDVAAGRALANAHGSVGDAADLSARTDARPDCNQRARISTSQLEQRRRTRRKCEKIRRAETAGSSTASPVEERPAACDSVAKATPRSRHPRTAASRAQNPPTAAERDRICGDFCPHVPERQRLRLMGVLDGPPMADKAPQHACTVAPTKRRRMSRGWPSAPSTDAAEPPQREPVARGEFWGRRALFGAHAIVAGAEGDRHEAREIAKD